MNSRTENRPEPPRASFRAQLWLVAGLILVGLLARLPRLGESLWYDEIAAWSDYGRHGPGTIITTYYDPANHVAHTLATWVSHTLFAAWLGEATAIRLPALLFSLAAIVAIHGLAHHVAGPRVATIAGLLAAILPVAVLEGVEARAYAMMIATAAAATWMLLIARQNPRWSIWLGYALVCALGIWAHLMTVWIPIGHAAWLAWRAVVVRDPAERRFLIGGCLSIAMAAIITLALYAPLLDDLLRIRRDLLAVEGDEPAVFGIEGVHTIWQLGGSWYWWAAVPGLALTLLGALTAWIDPRQRVVIPLTLLGLPLMIATLALADSWLYARFALFALPGAIVLMAVGMTTLWRLQRIAGAVALLTIVLCAAMDLIVRPPKQPLREAATFIMNTDVAHRPVLVVGLRHQVMPVYQGALRMYRTQPLGADLETQIETVRPGWIIVLYPRSIDAERLATLAERGFQRAARFPGWADWGNGDVLVYRRVQSPD